MRVTLDTLRIVFLKSTGNLNKKQQRAQLKLQLQRIGARYDRINKDKEPLTCAFSKGIKNVEMEQQKHREIVYI